MLSPTKIKNLLINAVLFLALFVGFLAFASILPESWIKALDNAGIVLSFLVTCLAGAGVIFALSSKPELKRWVQHWLSRREFAHAGQVVEDFEKRVDALVITLGLRTLQAEWIVRHLKPRRVSLLFTTRGRSAAADLARKLEGEVTFDPSSLEIATSALVLEDLLDPQESRGLVRRYLERFLERGFVRERVFVDTTGGTAPMSMGAFQAAEEMRVSSIYVMGLMSDGEREGQILDPMDPAQGEPRFMSDHTTAAT